MSEEPALQLREYSEKDAGLVYQSWLNSYRHSKFASCIRVSLFFTEHRRVIDELVRRCETICAVDPEDPTHIYGWACIETGGAVPVLHYVFVKPPYRGFGIARKLLAPFATRPFFYTHLGRDVDKSRIANGSYLPHLAFKGIA